MTTLSQKQCDYYLQWVQLNIVTFYKLDDLISLGSFRKSCFIKLELFDGKGDLLTLSLS